MKGNYLVLATAILALHCGTEPAKQEEPKPQQQAAPVRNFQPAPQPPAPTGGTEEAQPAGNRPPKLTGAKIVGAPDGGFKVEATTDDPDGDTVKLSYVWSVNGEEISRGETSGPVKKGDMVSVVVTPSDGANSGPPENISMYVKNTPPKVQRNENLNIDDNGMLTYQIVATDADGDKLIYSLTKAPNGMQIDPSTGKVTWDTRNVPDGDYSATVQVSDDVSAALYTFQVNLHK